MYLAAYFVLVVSCLISYSVHLLVCLSGGLWLVVTLHVSKEEFAPSFGLAVFPLLSQSVSQSGSPVDARPDAKFPTRCVTSASELR